MVFIRILSTAVPAALSDTFPFQWLGVHNQWTKIRSAPTITLHGDDHLLCWRVSDNRPEDLATRNNLRIVSQISGENDSGMTDYDDVGRILSRGLRESLLEFRP